MVPPAPSSAQQVSCALRGARGARYGRQLQAVVLALLTGGAVAACGAPAYFEPRRRPLSVDELRARNQDLAPSRATLYRWQRHYEEWGESPADTDAYMARCVRLRHSEGVRARSKRLRRQDAIRALKGIAEEHPWFYLDEFRDELRRSHGAWLPVASVRRHLRQAGLTRQVLSRKARQRDELLRTQYMLQLKRLVVRPEQLVFVDETRRDGRRCCCWPRQRQCGGAARRSSRARDRTYRYR